MLTVTPVYKLLNVSDDLKWTINTHVTPFTFTFEADNIYGFGRLCLLLIFLPVHPYFYPSTTVYIRPNDGCMGLCIKIWFSD